MKKINLKDFKNGLARKEMKLIFGGKTILKDSCVSSDTCTQGCAIIDSEGCSEWSGCCIA